MSARAGIFSGLLASDGQADRVVPPSGFTAQLTVFAAGAMAFLAVFALALSLSAGRLAERWGSELAHTATLRITAPLEQRGVQTQAALRILETTRGVAKARALTDAEQNALLAPWFGTGISLDGLPVPRLIEIAETPEGIDPAGLRLRLAAEVPGAVLDDHSRWRDPLVRAATRLRIVSWAAIALIAATVAAMITLAAQAALAANAQVIAVLRLVGATDDYIAQAFIRRFTLRAGMGALAGSLIGMALIALIPAGSAGAAGLLSGLGLRGFDWFWPLLVPLLAAAVAFFATRAAARRTLRSLT